ncbi:MAG: hypothetical protein V3581_01990 [Candidatus Cardinium sp.]
MLYIRSLFKTVALFYLSTVLSPGCASLPKQGGELKASSKEKAKTLHKKPVQSGDKKASKNEIKPPQQPFIPSHSRPSLPVALTKNEIKPPQQPFIPSHSRPSLPVASTPSQDANQEKRKKVFEGSSQKCRMMSVKELLRKKYKLPDQIIKDYGKDIKESVQDNFSKVDKKFTALPFDEQKLLIDYSVRCEQVNDEYWKQCYETCRQVQKKFGQLANLLHKGEHYEIDVSSNPSEPIFQDIIKVSRESAEIIKMSSSDFIYFISTCMKMEKAFLECSSQEQATYLPHLEDIRSLLMPLSEKQQKVPIQVEKQFPIYKQILEKIRSIMEQDKKVKNTYSYIRTISAACCTII